MQAVSLYIASYTGAWSSRLDSDAAVPFDAEAIARSLRALVTTQAEFEVFFASHGIVPLRLCYEEIETDLRRALRRVCRHVGIERPGTVPLPPVALQKQRTARNEEFAAQFRELHRHGAGLD
jgi:LPS sulfotransferase NodH